MQPMDLVILGSGLALFLLGALLGFGKVFKWIVSGIVGKISAGVITYFLYGVVLNWSLVNRLTTMLVDKLTANGNWICKLLLAIRIDLILLLVVLFFLVLAAIKLFAAIVSGIAESELPVMRTLNHLSGAVLLPGYICIWVLILFQLSAWIFGTGGGLYPFLEGSALHLEAVYLNNPLNAIFETIKHSISGLVG